MNTNFVSLPSDDTLSRLCRLLEVASEDANLIICYTDQSFCVLTMTAVKQAISDIGENLGPSAFELTLQSIPEFRRTCEPVSLAESETTARELAIRCPEKQIAVLDNEKPVGVVKAQVRSALFGGLPSTLYGKRYDIFEKGAVRPREQLSCPHCKHQFDFYDAVLNAGQIEYCCPKCKAKLKEH